MQPQFKTQPTVHSAIGESGLSIECAFDKKQYMKEIIIRRRKILDAMPESPGVLRTCYKLEASGQDIPQVQPNVLFEDGSITLHHLSMYIKRKIGLLPFQPLYFYTKVSTTLLHQTCISGTLVCRKAHTNPGIHP